MKVYLLGPALLCSVILSAANAQDTSRKPFQIETYIDVYAAYYNDSVAAGDYQKFPTVSPRSKQVGLNILMIKAKYQSANTRANLSVQVGDIPASTWSAKYNLVQEANAGILLTKGLWLDAGFFRTHFGTEALLPKENITSSVAVGTFFEPYYQAGLRLNYTYREKLVMYLYALNGYGLYEDNNEKLSAGLLITYAFSDRFNIGYSGYYGDDALLDEHFRIGHNAFLNYKTRKLKLTLGGDYITQQHSRLTGSSAAVATSALLSASEDIANKTKIYGRVEVFSDPDGILSGTFTDRKHAVTGLVIEGLTVGLEYKPSQESYVRFEARELIASPDQEIFHWNHSNHNTRFEAMLHFGITM